MAQIDELLASVGLTSTETAIYQAGLGFPSVSVQELLKQTRIKRPTIYHALETLMEKGLVAKRGTGSRLQFVMSAPDRLHHLIDQKISLLEQQKTSLDAVLPLLAKRGAPSDHVESAQYDGIEGVKTVVEEAIYCRSGHWDILAPRKNFFYEFDKAYADYFLAARKSHGITSRSLWEEDPNRRVLSAAELRERQPRILPKSMHGRFKDVIILFDDKVAFVSSLETATAVVIQSREVHETMLAMFDVLWDASTKMG